MIILFQVTVSPLLDAILVSLFEISNQRSPVLHSDAVGVTVEPKILFTVDGYYYNGMALDSLGKISEVLADLPSVQMTIVFPLLTDDPAIGGVPNGTHWRHFIAAHDAGDIDFAQLPFDHPLYILYSSGTTGAPK